MEGHEPGDEIRLSAEDSASPRVRVNVASIAPLDTVEVVVNGEIVHTWRPSGDGPNWELETTVNVPGSAWIAARATGPPFAQTSPIYVVRDGRHFTSASDARFLLESVDELWRRVQERNSWTNEEQKRAYERVSRERGQPIDEFFCSTQTTMRSKSLPRNNPAFGYEPARAIS